MTSETTKKLHIGIIMDGNGRWAKARGLPRTMGHKAGIEAVRHTLKAVRDLPISHLTLYSFSTENWRRPKTEIADLMGLLRFYLQSELSTLHKEGVRVKIIGERDTLPTDIVDLINKAEVMTHENEALTLTLALSYGGRQEIVAAARGIAVAVQNGSLKPEEINEDVVQSFLYTDGTPDPDLIIRTSGEQRLSNFLPWQAAYAEFVFTDVLWPDFGAEHLTQAIDEFYGRERRYGDTVAHD